MWARMNRIEAAKFELQCAREDLASADARCNRITEELTEAVRVRIDAEESYEKAKNELITALQEPHE